MNTPANRRTARRLFDLLFRPASVEMVALRYQTRADPVADHALRSALVTRLDYAPRPELPMAVIGSRYDLCDGNTLRRRHTPCNASRVGAPGGTRTHASPFVPGSGSVQLGYGGSGNRSRASCLPGQASYFFVQNIKRGRESDLPTSGPMSSFSVAPNWAGEGLPPTPPITSAQSHLLELRPFEGR